MDKFLDWALRIAFVVLVAWTCVGTLLTFLGVIV